MARYTGPKTKISRAFGQKLFGADKGFDKLKASNKLNPPGQHGATKRRKQRSDYALQLMEKQKAKYIYGLLERQFFKTFQAAVRRSGVTGEVLLQLLEARLDNTVFRLGIAPTRNAARQLVSHNHITVNGRVVNIPSFSLRPGDVIAVRGRSQNFEVIETALSRKTEKNAWLEWNRDKMEGVFLAFPTRDQITETINEQLILELYSK
jgi:small subunit ribosomal protein S4